jgi:hypothetical protein
MLAAQGLADSSSAGRSALWGFALELINSNPFKGIGPMHFAEIHYQQPVAHPHNIILQLLAEWGIIATLLLTGIAIYGLVKWINFSRHQINSTPESTILYTALTAAFIAGNSHALMSGTWVMPLSQLSLIIITGWMYGLYIHKNPKPITFIPKYVFITAILLTLIGFIYGLYPELSHFKNWFEASLSASGSPLLLHPRFWSQGYIL